MSEELPIVPNGWDDLDWEDIDPFDMRYYQSILYATAERTYITVPGVPAADSSFSYGNNAYLLWWWDSHWQNMLNALDVANPAFADFCEATTNRILRLFSSYFYSNGSYADSPDDQNWMYCVDPWKMNTSYGMNYYFAEENRFPPNRIYYTAGRWIDFRKLGENPLTKDLTLYPTVGTLIDSDITKNWLKSCKNALMMLRFFMPISATRCPQIPGEYWNENGRVTVDWRTEGEENNNPAGAAAAMAAGKGAAVGKVLSEGVPIGEPYVRETPEIEFANLRRYKYMEIFNCGIFAQVEVTSRRQWSVSSSEYVNYYGNITFYIEKNHVWWTNEHAVAADLYVIPYDDEEIWDVKENTPYHPYGEHVFGDFGFGFEEGVPKKVAENVQPGERIGSLCGEVGDKSKLLPSNFQWPVIGSGEVIGSWEFGSAIYRFSQRLFLVADFGPYFRFKSNPYDGEFPEESSSSE